MNDAQLLFAILDALLTLARSDHPARVDNVAGRLGVRSARVAGALLHLERRELVDASRVRLTLRGLAAATALRAAADSERLAA